MPYRKLSLKKFILYEMFLLAICASLLALALYLKIDFFLDSSIPFIFFSINSVFLTIYFNAKVGIPNLLIEGTLSYFFFVPPYFSWGIPDTPTLALFVAVFFASAFIQVSFHTIKNMLIGFAEHH
jgi:formate-dependent nitrite reductase membrane component NrfD